MSGDLFGRCARCGGEIATVHLCPASDPVAALLVNLATALATERAARKAAEARIATLEAEATEWQEAIDDMRARLAVPREALEGEMRGRCPQHWSDEMALADSAIGGVAGMSAHPYRDGAPSRRSEMPTEPASCPNCATERTAREAAEADRDEAREKAEDAVLYACYGTALRCQRGAVQMWSTDIAFLRLLDDETATATVLHSVRAAYPEAEGYYEHKANVARVPPPAARLTSLATGAFVAPGVFAPWPLSAQLEVARLTGAVATERAARETAEVACAAVRDALITAVDGDVEQGEQLSDTVQRIARERDEARARLAEVEAQAQTAPSDQTEPESLRPWQCPACRQFGDSGGCRNKSCLRSRPIGEQVAALVEALRAARPFVATRLGSGGANMRRILEKIDAALVGL